MKIASTLLTENNFLTADVLLKRRSGRAEKANILVLRFNGGIYAYLNHCMHMQRRLNCQKDTIFDHERLRLRCSMHGYIFEPESGVCLSPVCEGQYLQKFKLSEHEGFIRLLDKKAEIIAVYRHGKDLV